MAGVAEDLAALAPKLAERGDDIAAARRLPDDVVGALREAGAFRIAAPRALGGPELTPREQTEVVETLSMHEASVGWCTMIGSDAPYYGSFLAPEAAAELWPSIDVVTAGQIPPNGQARRVDDGYIINGRWAFGSGCTHADVIVGGSGSNDYMASDLFVPERHITRPPRGRARRSPARRRTRLRLRLP